MRFNREIAVFAAGALGQNFVSGAALVALAWTVLETTGSYEAVGIVFLVGNLTNLFVVPFVGVLVDRFDRRKTYLLGGCLSALALTLPVFAAANGPSGLWAFYAVAVVTSVGNGAQHPSLESLLQRIVPVGELSQVAAARNLLRQIGLVGGAGVGGVLVAISGPSSAFALGTCIATSAAFAVRLGMPEHRPANSVRGAYFAAMFDGFRFLGRADILRTGAVIVASWSAGQTINAALAGYVRERGFDAAVYGIGDACWSVGAFLTALWLARHLHRQQPSERAAVLGVGGLGASLIALSFAPGRPAIFAVCALLGAFFSLAKVSSDSRFIVICERDILGRVRSNLTALSGGVGAFVYLAPTLLALPASTMLMGWGALLLVAAGALAIARR
ncbi:MAG: MFS transporter [Alphaproteobacteria bacterium]|nr:MFS transporter [Alphaproteobacteria bacterium]